MIIDYLLDNILYPIACQYFLSTIHDFRLLDNIFYLQKKLVEDKKRRAETTCRVGKKKRTFD